MFITDYKNAVMNKLSKDEQSKLDAIIDRTQLVTNIVNPKSRFVIITYWWGRGNLNKNLQYPCPEDVKSDNPITQEPKKFEDMIDDWKNTCFTNNCNYLVAEYPEFAVPGGYQLAINAKPLFIKKALEAAGGRGVVYIDGDMTVNKYPALFDLPNIDFMARGWNIDPRANVHYKKKPCFDPFIFETSGGTMYFGPTKEARYLLDLWAAASAKPMFAGKADDRILSMIYTMKSLALSINTIQLPIEYLWLTEHYTPKNAKSHLDSKDYNKSDIIFEHPACLTSEERAADQGAAKNRQPRFYDKLIEDLIDCQNSGGFFYEYIAFPTKEHVKCFQPYLNYIGRCVIGEEDDEELYAQYLVKYSQTYGKYKENADGNNSKAAELALSVKGNLSMIKVLIDNTIIQPEFKSEIVKTNEAFAIPVILACLRRGHNVLYVPSGTNPKSTKTILKEINKGAELIAFNGSDNNYRPALLTDKMMYFKSSNVILQHMLAMCKTLSDPESGINRQLKSFMFIQRIRCYWIGYEKSSSSKSSSSKGSKETRGSRKKQLTDYLSKMSK